MGIVLLAGLLSAPTGPPFDLVRDGRPVATIVTADAPDPAEKGAASELAHYLKLATGAALPIVTESQAPAGPQVHVGRTQAAQGAGVPPSGLDRDGIVLRTAKERLFLCGGDPYATYFAVTRFLQTQCGCRWYIPTELGEHIPQTGTVRAPGALNVVEEPSYLSRLWSRPADMDPNWARRNYSRARFSFHHNLLRVFTPEVYDQHPEFFPLIDGKRRRPTGPDDHSWQPCFSNAQAARFAAGVAAKAFDADPSLASFSLGINDSNGYCQCENCARLTDPQHAEFRGRPNRSNQVFTFMNRVARELMLTHSDKYIGCLAYSWCEDVPTTSVHDHVIPYLTNDRAQWRDPKFRADDEELIRRWCAEQPFVGMYDYYYGSGYVIPRVYTRLSDESLKFASRTGVKAFYGEIYSNWSLDGPKAWLASQLLWDPEQSAEELLDGFYTDMFAESAVPMRRHFELCEKRWTNQTGEARWFKGFFELPQMELFPPEVCQEARALLGQAEKAARSDLTRRRVRLYSEGFRQTELYSDLYFGDRALAQLAVRDRGDLETGLAATLQVSRASAALNDLEAQVIEPNPLHKSPIPFTERARFDALSGALQFMTGAVTWADDHGQWAAAKGVLDELAAEWGDGPTGRLARALVYLHEHPRSAAETAVNGDVEGGQAGGPMPQGPDWSSDQMPAGWSKWVRPGTPGELAWTTEEARSGLASLKATGAIACCFLQTIPVRAGEEYLCSCYAKALVPDGGRVELLIQWHDAQGKWFTAPNAVARLPVGETDGWQRLQTYFRVPEGAAKAVVGLVAYDQGDRGYAYFDDVSCLRLALPPTVGGRP
jgi:hypothetical protein